MPSSRPDSSDRVSLKKRLEDAEKELRRRLAEACEAEAKGVSSESTNEIRQLEDSLLAAAQAAKETIAARSQMERPESGQTAPPIKTVATEHDQDTMGVRELVDEQGRAWRAWSVVPGRTKTTSSGGRFLGDFQNGWICFEGLDASARRRLPYPRAKWSTVSDEELRQLLQQAIDAPIREKKR
jgi:hypothetical protein